MYHVNIKQLMEMLNGFVLSQSINMDILVWYVMNYIVRPLKNENYLTNIKHIIFTCYKPRQQKTANQPIKGIRLCIFIIRFLMSILDALYHWADVFEDTKDARNDEIDGDVAFGGAIVKV